MNIMIGVEAININFPNGPTLHQRADPIVELMIPTTDHVIIKIPRRRIMNTGPPVAYVR